MSHFSGYATYQDLACLFLRASLSAAGKIVEADDIKPRDFGDALPFVLVGGHDDTCRRYVIPNQLQVDGVRGAAEEFFAFSKNYRTGEQ